MKGPFLQQHRSSRPQLFVDTFSTFVFVALLFDEQLLRLYAEVYSD